MSTELNLDIAALVGEMEAPGCEHSQHGTNNLHGGPATHYVRGIHPCVEPTHAYTACQRMVSFVLADVPAMCGACGEMTTTAGLYEILGPVTK